MRIEELWLDAYGPFTGVRLALQPSRMNVVFGPNEAGKSTSLRAIEALLFEHEPHTRDAHVHAMPKLRVGGVLTTKAGATFSFFRRKGKTQTVLDVHGNPIDDAPLASMLGGIGREAFRAVYGLDHLRLAEGGKALAEGEGLVGESLFAASMGIVHLHRLRQALDEEGEAIYKPRGNRPLSSELDLRKKALDEAELGATSAETVASDRAELEQRRRDRAELKERKLAQETERARLVRVRNVRPPLMELRAVKASLEQRGEPRMVDPKAREDAERIVAGSVEEHIAADLEKARAERAGVPLDMKVLAYKGEIESLWKEQRGAHLKAASDRIGLEHELAPLEKKLAALEATAAADVSALEAVLVRHKTAGTREAQLETAERELEDLVRSTEDDLESLGLDADIAKTPKLVVPSDEAIEDAERAEEPHQTRIEELERAIAQREQRIRELEDEIADLRASDTPTEEELRAAREKRDAQIDLLATQKGKATDAVRAVASADRLVDRMRADAATASTLALRQRELETAKKALARDAGALDQAKKDLAKVRKDWEKAWSKLGIEIGSPSEMRAWHRRFVDARDACVDVEQRRRKLEAEQKALEKIRAELEKIAKPLGLRADSVGELLDKIREHHRKLERTELMRTKEIESARDKVDSLKERIAKIDRDAQAFRARVSALVRNVDPKLDPEQLIAALDALYERFLEAERNRTFGERLEKRIAELGAKLTQDRARIAEARGALERLLKLAGASSLEELRRFELEASEIAQQRKRCAELESDLARLGDGRSIADLETEAEQVTSIEEARARIEELDLMIEQTSAELDQVTRQVHGFEEGMKRYEQPLADAAVAVARAEEHLAKARELALRYARLKLAGSVLSRAIERLRDKSQGPVLVRAGAIFKAITLGSFEKLTVDLGEDDQPVLSAVRTDGRETGVLGMSDGTRDQLYLALRIASLERLAESGDPLPLVLDDVLMSFDDDRARATLRVLGELGRHMQVMLFTHHVRTVELAREAVEDLAVSELPTPTAVSAA